MIDIRLLQAAVTIAEERNITRAAERLRLTQPALSKQLADLEERVGFILFERRGRKFAVTEAGASFVEHARTALAEIERAIQSGRSALVGAGQTICVARSPCVDPYFASVMRSVRLPLYPGLDLRFSSHFAPEALRLLRSGGADLALTEGIDEPGNLSFNRLRTNPFFVAMSSFELLSSKESLKLQDLQGRKLILFERRVNPAVYDRLEQALASETIHFEAVEYVQTAEEAAAHLLQTNCLALLTQNGAWRIADGAIAIRPLVHERLLLSTFLSTRLDEPSRMLSDFLRVYGKRLTTDLEQVSPELLGRVRPVDHARVVP